MGEKEPEYVKVYQVPIQGNRIVHFFHAEMQWDFIAGEPVSPVSVDEIRSFAREIGAEAGTDKIDVKDSEQYNKLLTYACVLPELRTEEGKAKAREVIRRMSKYEAEDWARMCINEHKIIPKPEKTPRRFKEKYEIE